MIVNGWRIEPPDAAHASRSPTEWADTLLSSGRVLGRFDTAGLMGPGPVSGFIGDKPGELFGPARKRQRDEQQ